MENNQQLYNRIEKYLKGMLSPSEKQAFENEYDNDVNLQTKVDNYLTAKNVMKSHYRNQKLKRIEDTYAAFLQKRQRQKRIIYSMLAAASIVFIVAFWLWPAPTMQEIYLAEINTTLVGYVESNVRGDDSLQNPARAFANVYETKTQAGYPEQIQQLIQQYTERLSDSTVIQDELYLYLGFCYVELDKPKEALEQFLKIKDNVLVAQEWFVALTYLRLEEKEKAITQLQQIVAYPNHDYYNQATKILRTLKRDSP